MKPEDFLKRITNDQFLAVVERHGFSEEDLDDINNARVVFCELAHGPSPFKHWRVGVTCGGEDCVDSDHLKWVELPPIEQANDELDDLVDTVENASNLDELLHALQAFERALDLAIQAYGLDDLKPRRRKPLPTFGSQPPTDALGVVSWDKHRLLLSSGTDWQIVNRAEWRGWPAETRAMLEGWSSGQSQH